MYTKLNETFTLISFHAPCGQVQCDVLKKTHLILKACDFYQSCLCCVKYCQLCSLHNSNEPIPCTVLNCSVFLLPGVQTWDVLGTLCRGTLYPWVSSLPGMRHLSFTILKPFSILTMCYLRLDSAYVCLDVLILWGFIPSCSLSLLSVLRSLLHPLSLFPFCTSSYCPHHCSVLFVVILLWVFSFLL